MTAAVRRARIFQGIGFGRVSTAHWGMDQPVVFPATDAGLITDVTAGAIVVPNHVGELWRPHDGEIVWPRVESEIGVASVLSALAIANTVGEVLAPDAAGDVEVLPPEPSAEVEGVAEVPNHLGVVTVPNHEGEVVDYLAAGEARETGVAAGEVTANQLALAEITNLAPEFLISALNTATVLQNEADESYMRWVKYTASYADLSAAATTSSHELLTLQSREVIGAVVVKHDIAFAGTGITDYMISLGTAADNDRFLEPYDVTQPVTSDTAVIADGSHLVDFSSDTAVSLYATSVGANLDQAITGTLRLWVLVGRLPE